MSNFQCARSAEIWHERANDYMREIKQARVLAMAILKMTEGGDADMD